MALLDNSQVGRQACTPMGLGCSNGARMELMEPWDLRTRQLQPGYDHWECFYSECDECWNAHATKPTSAKVSTQKIVRRVVQIIFWAGLIGLFVWANRTTTPVQCRVDVSQMSQFCKDLLFPH